MHIEIKPPLFSGRNTVNYFHPAIAAFSDGTLIMSAQTFEGSDYYGNPCFALSRGSLEQWSTFSDIPGMETQRVPRDSFAE